MKEISSILISVSLLLRPLSVTGWNSVGKANHRQLTIDAEGLIDNNEYPDIHKFYGTIMFLP